MIAFNEQGIVYDVLEEQCDFDCVELVVLWLLVLILVLRDGEQVIGEMLIIIEYVVGARLVLLLEARKWDCFCD